jgi:hypothetical protein
LFLRGFFIGLVGVSAFNIRQTRSIVAKVTVIIRNGVAEAIEGIPKDMFVEVRNYDVANVTGGLLSRDAYGKPCQVKEWHAPE